MTALIFPPVNNLLL